MQAVCSSVHIQSLRLQLRCAVDQPFLLFRLQLGLSPPLELVFDRRGSSLFETWTSLFLPLGPVRLAFCQSVDDVLANGRVRIASLCLLIGLLLVFDLE